MVDRHIHSEPIEVTAKQGAVVLFGPGAIDLILTPEAAEETSDRLAEQAVIARGQRRLDQLTLRPK